MTLGQILPMMKGVGKNIFEIYFLLFQIFFVKHFLFVLQTEIQRNFEYTSEDFTLEKIIEFGFDQHGEFINTVSGAAKKELSIEQVWYSFLKSLF